MKALGMIEVNGYLAAVEAADAALKAANVTLIGIEIVKAGISNVQVVGDVDAVQASVDAGRAAANSLGLLRSSHVIPRPHEELLKIFPNLEKKKEDSPVEKVKDDNDKIHKEDVIAPSKMEKTEDIKQSKDITQEIVKLEKTLENYRNKKEKALKENVKKDENTNYGDMKVETLRNMVRALKLPNMSSKQIKQEKKEELIN